MPRPRPLLTIAGAVSCALLLVSACGGEAVPVSVETPDLIRPAARACADLVEALPDTVSDQQRRTVEPEGAPGAGWGDPAIVLQCGVPLPQGFDRFSSCQITDGVAWFIPDEQITGSAVDVVMTTIGRAPGVEVAIPADYFPPASTMVDLAPALKEHTEKVEACD